MLTLPDGGRSPKYLLLVFLGLISVQPEHSGYVLHGFGGVEYEVVEEYGRVGGSGMVDDDEKESKRVAWPQG